MSHQISFWVYVRSEPGLWTVGFYDPAGEWHTDSDHNSSEEAAKRAHYLNGGMPCGCDRSDCSTDMPA